MDIQFNEAEILMIAPMIVMFLASIIPLTIKVFQKNKELNPITTLSCACVGILSAFILSAGIYSYSMQPISLFDKALVLDGISVFSTFIILIATFCTVLFSKESYSVVGNQFSEYIFLLMNSAIGMMILAYSNDLIVTFIGIEMMSLCLYLMIAMSNDSGSTAKESALKYFVLGSFASAIFLYGLAFIYGTTGTTYINELAEVASQLVSINRLFLVGLTLLILGFCFKVAIFPFHSWAPDVYQGAPTPLTSFMATGVKIVSFIAFLRVITTEALLGDRADVLITALQWLAVITIIVGNVAAIIQSDMKRMLAYSSVAHSGYIMIGLIAAGIGGQAALGASSLLFYSFAYLIMTIGTFGIVSLFEHDQSSSLQVEDLKGLATKRPWLAFILTLFLLSLAGIPPTIGFFGKFYLFSAAIKQGLFWMAIWGVIGSVISVYYYLKPIVYMYMQEDEWVATPSEKPLTSLMILVTAISVIGYGLFSGPIYDIFNVAVKYLF